MNKIFKKVFNASRGKMMVVSEATSSVQKGKNLVAASVVVMGAWVSTLAVAAPLTGALTQDVYGKSDVIEAGSYTLASLAIVDLENVTLAAGAPSLNVVGGAVQTLAQNSTVRVGSDTAGTFGSGVSIRDSDFASKTSIIGAGLLKNNTSLTKKDTATYYGSYVELHNVQAQTSDVIGGGKIDSSRLADLTVTHTNLKLTGETDVSKVVGGSFVRGSMTTASRVSTGDTHIYIGKGVKVRDMVVGGNFSSYYGKNASVKSTNIVIEGADLSSAMLIGGNYFNAGGSAAIDTESSTIKTNITIKDSVVGALYATDYLDNDNANRTYVTATSDASVTIENSVIKGDLIGGTYAQGANIDADVERKIDLQLKDVKVEGIVTTDNLEVDQNQNKTIVENSIQDSSIDLTNVEADAVHASKGVVQLRAEGDGTVRLDSLQTAEGVEVLMSADGTANDASGGDITKAIAIADGSYGDAIVTMEEGLYNADVNGVIEGGKVKVEAVGASSTMQNVLDMGSNATLSLNRIVLNDVRKRLGDLRSAEGTHGVWARYNGGKFSGDRGFENDFHTLQVGIDTVPVADAPRFGVAFSYTKADADMNRGGAEMDAYSLAFYGTKFYDNGVFVDVIGRLAKADTDVTVDVDGVKTGSMDNLALSLSGELGWRLKMTERHYVEPQVELTYTNVDSDTLKMTGGNEFVFESVDSLLARFGVAAGFECPNNFGNVYVRASAVHEFLGDAAVVGKNGKRLETNGKDTWVEFGIGANFNLNKNTYVYADLECTEGAKLETDWRANVGVRYSF